jgi:hypothetical protein
MICFSKEEALASITYSYKHGFSGFAAMLTDDQAQDLAGGMSLPLYLNKLLLV